MPNYPRGRIYPGYGGLLCREQTNGISVIRTAIYPTQATDYAHRLASYFSFVGSSAVLGSGLLGKLDYLLVESPPLFLGLAGMWLASVSRARLIFNVSDLWPSTAVQLGVLRAGSLAHRLSLRLEAKCYRRAWLVTGQSGEIVADIQARFPGTPVFHLSNGVDTSIFRPDRATPAARQLLQSDGRCTVVYAGLHGLAQGLNHVIDVVKRLQDCLTLVMIGDGPEKDELMAQARQQGIDQVSFFDPVPRSEVPPLLASADIIVVPLRTRIDGAVPSKLYEAMASGRPVMLVAEGEAADLVRQHNTGLVAAPGDKEGLFVALQSLATDPTLRAQLGQNGRRLVEASFDRAVIGRRFAEFLEQHDH
jgi:glycosyltransferase involved in cell wall biosynthesis